MSSLKDADYERAYRYAMALCGDRDMAYDVVHNAVANWLQAAPKNVLEPLGYFLRILHNCFIADAKRAAMLRWTPLEDVAGVIATDMAPLGEQPGNPQRRRLLAMAATVVAASGLGLWLSRREAHAEHIVMLAEEVAFTHLTYSAAAGVALDVLGNDIGLLRLRFSAVGFALIDAAAIGTAALDAAAINTTVDPALKGAELVGGRLCVLTAAPAVQLRYRGVQGEVSVCQTRFHPQRHRDVPDLAAAGAAPTVLHARGVRVSLAHRQGVLFAVAVAA